MAQVLEILETDRINRGGGDNDINTLDIDPLTTQGAMPSAVIVSTYTIPPEYPGLCIRFLISTVA